MIPFVEDLNNLCHDLDNRYDINSGGCCYVAYIIAKNLEKHHIPYQLVVANDYYVDSNTLEVAINNRTANCNGLGRGVCNHYYLHTTFGDINPGDEYDESTTIDITSRDLLWIYTSGRWNWMFQRRYKSVISRIINRFFNETFSEE